MMKLKFRLASNDARHATHIRQPGIAALSASGSSVRISSVPPGAVAGCAPSDTHGAPHGAVGAVDMLRPCAALTDETGRRVKIPRDVKRVVSLAPNLTEIVFALGEGKSIWPATPTFAIIRLRPRRSRTWAGR